MHRRAQILDSLYELFEPLREDSKDRYDDSEFPLRVLTVQKRYQHWTVLDQAGALPALLLNFDEVLRNREGGANAAFAALGETEEYLPIALDVVLKEVSVDENGALKDGALKDKDLSETLKTFLTKPMTDQVSDSLYTVEKLIKGTPDLDVEGVCKTRIAEVHTSAGRITALQGTPFEIVRHRIVVTHVYPSNASV